MMTQNAAIEILRASRLNTVGGEKVLLHLPIWPLQDDVSNKISTVARGDHHVIPGFSNWQQQHAIHSREHLLPFYPLLCPARLFFVFFFFFFVTALHPGASHSRHYRDILPRYKRIPIRGGVVAPWQDPQKYCRLSRRSALTRIHPPRNTHCPIPQYRKTSNTYSTETPAVSPTSKPKLPRSTVCQMETVPDPLPSLLPRPYNAPFLVVNSQSLMWLCSKHNWRRPSTEKSE